MLPGRKLRTRPSYIICPTDVFVEFIQEQAGRGAVDTGHIAEKLVPNQAELVWIPTLNIIIIPERLVDMSQSLNELHRMDARMKLTEDTLHAVTTVEDPRNHTLRTGFYDNIIGTINTGLQSGTVYRSSQVPTFEENGVIESDDDEKPETTTLGVMSRVYTEGVTTVIANMLMPTVCKKPEYTTMQFALRGPMGDIIFEVNVKSNRSQLIKLMQALFDGNWNALQAISIEGVKSSVTSSSERRTSSAQIRESFSFRFILDNLRHCRMVPYERSGNRELDAYNYQASRVD